MKKLFCQALGLIFISSVAWSQTTTYVSSPDRELSINKWTLYPLADNAKGVYAEPLEKELISLLESEQEFQFVPAANFKKISPEDFEEKKGLAAEFQKASKVQGFWAGRISKGPSGISIRLALFSGAEGKPLLIESKSEIQTFETRELKEEIKQLYRQMKLKIPYRGVVLSRRGLQVTINLGKSSGLTEGQDIDSIQILQIQRHPRFHFLVSTEKEIMGKIRITKVDDKISFGVITSERTDGQVQVGSKVTFDQFVKYSAPVALKDGSQVDGITNRSDSDVAFGSDPKEWRPIETPSFGKVSLMLGLGTYTIATSPSSGNSLSSTQSFTPSFHVESEMWLSSNWFMGLDLHQYVAKISNDLSGSTPGSLDLQTLETELFGGYNFLASEEFWGPKFQLMFGMSQMDSKIQSSTPTSFTSSKYGGMSIGLGGSLPLSQEFRVPVTVGGKFIYYWNPTLTEEPVSSGDSSSNRISAFSIFGEWQQTPRLAYKAELGFRQYNSNFSGAGTRLPSASSSSHATTTLAGGVTFMF